MKKYIPIFLCFCMLSCDLGGDVTYSQANETTVKVTDAYGNTLKNQNVNFTVSDLYGRMESSTTKTSDSEGLALFSYTLFDDQIAKFEVADDTLFKTINIPTLKVYGKGSKKPVKANLNIVKDTLTSLAVRLKRTSTQPYRVQISTSYIIMDGTTIRSTLSSFKKNNVAALDTVIYLKVFSNTRFPINASLINAAETAVESQQLGVIVASDYKGKTLDIVFKQ